MPLSTDVELSVNKKPKFPRRCIVCSGPEPDHKMRVGDLLVGWFSFSTDIPAGWSSVQVPVHRQCQRPFKLRRWLTRLGYMALVAAILYFFHARIESIVPAAFGRFGMKVVIVLMILPVAVLEILYPPRFDITAGKHFITFEFADGIYAAAFAKKNDEMRQYAKIVAKLESRQE